MEPKLERKGDDMSTPGPHLIDIEDQIDVLFALDAKVAVSTPSLLPLESPKELIDFLTVEHDSDTYLWKDEAGQPVGYLSVINFPDKNEMEVLSIGVDPDAQGKGYGKTMMEYAEALARKALKDKLTLVTNVKNTEAIDFYKEIGYKVVREVENYYGDGETRALLEKLVSYESAGLPAPGLSPSA